MPADSDGPPIFLVGFMGAGKSTIGPILARALGYDFFDLDDKIELRAGRSVREIFAEQGESEFRRLESNEIDACAGIRRTVIALGGGAYVSAENRSRLREIGRTIWIDCPFEVCFLRVANDPSRPLASRPAEMRALLEERRPAYECADLIVRAGSDRPAKIARETLGLLGGQAPFGE